MRRQNRNFHHQFFDMSKNPNQETINISPAEFEKEIYNAEHGINSNLPGMFKSISKMPFLIKVLYVEMKSQRNEIARMKEENKVLREQVNCLSEMVSTVAL